MFVMLSSTVRPGIFKHIRCRNDFYPRSKVKRFPVPDELVFWKADYPDYDPPDYTSPGIKGQSYADPDVKDASFHPVWNSLDRGVNRVSHVGGYSVVDGYPINPIGRTGIVGRGLLGRWGPNHAADPVVTRWKRDDTGEFVLNSTTRKKILQMVTIQRHDNKKWAIPGGMVDPGEKVSTTLKREFMEEALNTFGGQTVIEEFFSTGVEIYKGYVDDYRNTDNAWIETVACNFHDETGDRVGKLKLEAGDDAAKVKWLDLNHEVDLHANHAQIVEMAVKRLDAHW